MPKLVLPPSLAVSRLSWIACLGAPKQKTGAPNTAVTDVVLHEPPDAEVDGLELRVADDVVAGIPSAKKIKITKYKP